MPTRVSLFGVCSGCNGRPATSNKKEKTFTLEQAVKARRGRLTTLPGCFTSGKERVPIVQDVGWASGLDLDGWGKSTKRSQEFTSKHISELTENFERGWFLPKRERRTWASMDYRRSRCRAGSPLVCVCGIYMRFGVALTQLWEIATMLSFIHIVYRENKTFYKEITRPCTVVFRWLQPRSHTRHQLHRMVSTAQRVAFVESRKIWME
jgi:hypothetical protein